MPNPASDVRTVHLRIQHPSICPSLSLIHRSNTDLSVIPQPFNNLQFNMTQTLNGPSILCVGMAVQYLTSPPTPAYGNSTTR